MSINELKHFFHKLSNIVTQEQLLLGTQLQNKKRQEMLSCITFKNLVKGKSEYNWPPHIDLFLWKTGLSVGTCRTYWLMFTIASSAKCDYAGPSSWLTITGVREDLIHTTGWCYEHRHDIVKFSNVSKTSTTITVQKWGVYRLRLMIENAPFLLTILAKLTLTGAVCLFTELCDTLTDLHLFCEHSRKVVKLSKLSRNSTTDLI